MARKLTPRQDKIAWLIVAGFKNAEIAAELTVTVKTVRAHRYTLMKKLGAHNTTDIALALVGRHCASCTCGKHSKTEPASQPEGSPVAY